MLMQPEIVEREPQPYVAIGETVTMRTISALADSGFPELFAWMAARGVAPAGAPFFRYRVINMDRGLVVEAGIPTSIRVDGDDRVTSDVLPGGRYASVTHLGPYDDLVGANAALQEWASAHELRWDVTPSDAGEVWASRLEIYQTDPQEEPDPAKWRTDVAYLVAAT